MALWSDFTPEEQEALQGQILTPSRSLAGDLMRIVRRAELIKAAGDGGLTALLATLNDAAVIPRDPGLALAGAQDIVPADILALMSYWATLTDATKDNTQGSYNFDFLTKLAVKMAGVNASF